MDAPVSIIIPCFNQAHFLPSAVKSCLSQTYANREIIVIDDGSHDNVSAALQPFKDRVKLITQKNSGLSAARNTGIAHSQGEFIQLLDADDILEHDTIELQLKFLRENPNAKISVCRNKFFDELDPGGKPHLTGEWRLYHNALDAHLCYFNIAPPHAFLTRREVLLKIGGFDPQLKACEDYDFWLRAASLGFIPEYNRSGLVYYRKHDQSMSANIKNQTIHDAIMHHRLKSIIDNCTDFPAGRKLEGRLAFCAGALKTAVRLHNLNLAGHNRLLREAGNQLQTAANQLSRTNFAWNILSALFFLRIVSLISHSDTKPLPATNNALGEIKRIVASVWCARSWVTMARMALMNLIKHREEFFFESREVRHHLARLLLVFRF